MLTMFDAENINESLSMPQPDPYRQEADCAIIGGGLSGLSLSILLAQQGWQVFLFEKHIYPFHKVCGEYISLESKPFLERLGLSLPPSEFPHISRLKVTAVSGIEVSRPLD